MGILDLSHSTGSFCGVLLNLLDRKHPLDYFLVSGARISSLIYSVKG